jgi:hypothetical protein
LETLNALTGLSLYFRKIHGFLKCDASFINVVAVAVAVAVFISEENFSCGNGE